MAKRKRKEHEPVEAKGDAHEPPSVSAADLSGPWDGAGGAPAPDGQPQPADEQKEEAPGRQQSPQRAEKKPRSVLGRYFKDRRVQLIDDGNAGGVGIKLSYDDPAERPSDKVKEILKEGDEKRPGFTYQGARKLWHKRIGADADPRTAVAIRLDAERRVEAIGEQMSHEERLKAERSRGEEPGEKTPS
jgi:hypothetical protein